MNWLFLSTLELRELKTLSENNKNSILLKDYFQLSQETIVYWLQQRLEGSRPVLHLLSSILINIGCLIPLHNTILISSHKAAINLALIL